MDKVLLGDYIERVSIKALDLDDYSKLEALGVSNVDGITKTGHVKSADLGKYLYIEENYFAYNPYRINVGSIGLTPKDAKGLVSPAYIVFKTKKTLKPELLFDFLKSFDGIQQINKLAKGTVRKTLSFDNLSKIELFVPSIDKQQIILDLKIKTQSIHSELVNEIDNQQNLLTKLKQSILQEAIEGKLTSKWREQNQGIESASILLEKIKIEKENLIREKKIKRTKPLLAVNEDNISLSIPNNWKWCRINELITSIQYGTSKKCSETNISESPILRIPNISKGYINTNCLKYTVLTKKEKEQYSLKINDILVIRSNGSRELVGKSAIISNNMCNFGYAGYLIRLRFSNQFLNARYIHYCLNSAFLREQIETPLRTTVGINNINSTELVSLIIPLPPIEEQEAIVNKIEKLFAICDELEEQINSSKQNTQTLMQSVLKEAFEN